MRAVLLDALGTLVKLEPPAPRLRRELSARFGVRVSEAEAEAAIAAEIAYYRSHLDEGRDLSSVALLRIRCAEALAAALPARVAMPSVSALTEALLASLEFTAFGDVRPALEVMRARGLRLVVVSNWDASLHGVLERLSLTPLLDGVVTSAEVGARKPSPAIFAQALALAGAEAGAAIHVGDIVDEDIAGARAAGIEAVLLRRDGGSGPPGVRTIARLDQVLSGGAAAHSA
jgi:putative hydrolase of the HAD superfamily